MNEENIEKLNNLTLDLNFDLAILNSAISNFDENLEICMLENFVKDIYKKSEEIRSIFNN